MMPLFFHGHLNNLPGTSNTNAGTSASPVPLGVHFKTNIMGLKIILVAISLLTSVHFFSGCQSNQMSKEDWREIQSFIHDTFRVDPSIREQADLLMEGEP